MLIESIELDNFKSFGNKKKILFNKGLTVISGPNGSGKSNIGDSMLFVLGVRSARAIRAERLSDLIHQSSSREKQKNYCRVSLVIDTEKMELPEEQRKIKLTRELELENGEYRSTFYINGTKCRRSDVEHILDTSQIYLDSYSFVLQGDINNLIEMSGNERRKLLESIAGIESYNNQIDKAKSDIQGLVVNLDKIDILRGDHKARLDQLHDEKEQAELYNRLTGEIRDLKTTILQRQIISQNKERESLSRQLELIEGEIHSITADRDALKLTLKETREEIQKQQELRDRSSTSESIEIRNKINSLRVEIGNREIESRTLENEKSKLEEDLSRNFENIERFTSEKGSLEESLRTKQKELDSLNSRKEELDARFQSLLAAAGNSSRQLSDLQERLKDCDSRIAGLRMEEQSVNKRINEVEATKIGVLQKLSALEDRSQTVELEIKDARWRIKSIEDGSKEIVKERKDISDRYYKLRSLIEERNSERNELSRKHSELGREYEKLNATINAGMNRVSRPLAVIAAARSRREVTGIHGTLRELIAYDENFSMAVEAAAGGRFNSLVVDTDEVAEKCLAILRKEKAGKLTFLPLNKMASARPRGKAIMVRNSGDSLGYVFENVRYEKEYENVIWYCFQDTLIMPDVPTARKHMGGLRMVTLEGDIFESSGAITGGYTERKNTGSGEGRLRELTAKLSEIDSRLSEINEELSALNAEFDMVSVRLQESSKNEGADSGKLGSLQEIIRKSEPVLLETRKNIEVEKDKLLKLEEQLRELGNSEGSAVNMISDVEKEKESIFQEMKKFSPEIVEEKNRLERELNGMRDSIGMESSELEKLKVRMENTTQNILDAKEKEKSSRSRIHEIDEKVNGLRQEIAELKSDLSKHMQIEETLNKQLASINARISQLEKELAGISENIDSKNSEIASKHDIQYDFEVRKRVIADKILGLEAQLSELNGTPLVTPASMQELKSSVSEKEALVASMGLVNQKAIEEFDQEKEYIATLDQETEKLKSEKKDLESLEESLTEQKKVVFVKLFRDINLHMNSIYYNLSDGGEAMLVMSDEQNPLESEILIRAKPKGSNFNKIDSLSGGEKSLTAMAFIMAVQRINPSPIYYLDEVDMFLDGANAEHIGRMMKENSKSSQVLIVSLRKAMLKYSDQIIGVTTFDDENTDIFVKSFSEVKA